MSYLSPFLLSFLIVIFQLTVMSGTSLAVFFTQPALALLLTAAVAYKPAFSAGYGLFLAIIYYLFLPLKELWIFFIIFPLISLSASLLYHWLFKATSLITDCILALLAVVLYTPSVFFQSYFSSAPETLNRLSTTWPLFSLRLYLSTLFLVLVITSIRYFLIVRPRELRTR